MKRRDFIKTTAGAAAVAAAPAVAKAQETVTLRLH